VDDRRDIFWDRYNVSSVAALDVLQILRLGLKTQPSLLGRRGGGLGASDIGLQISACRNYNWLKLEGWQVATSRKYLPCVHSPCDRCGMLVDLL
jgi:hypothetical protein